MEAPACCTLSRSASAPSLDSLADSALALEAVPCSVLRLHALDDGEVAVTLRALLENTQQELLAAVAEGVLHSGRSGGGGRQYASDSADASEGEEGRQAGASCRCSGGSDQQRSSSVEGGGAGAEAVDELDLAGLSAREQDAAIKRAKNREAARRSRERKVERIAGLQGELDRLRSNNFVLLKCVEEVATKALHACAEQCQLKELLASVMAGKQGMAPGAAEPLGLPGSGACTPPATMRAAALEQELLRMETAPRSPTQLLPLPLWPGHSEEAAAAAALAGPPLRPMPTSAKLQHQLRTAVAGDSGIEGNAAGGAASGGSAADQHLLHPSPVSGRRALQQLQQLQQPTPVLPQHPVVLQLKQGALIRTCPAPGGLLTGAVAVAGAPELPRSWFRGVAV